LSTVGGGAGNNASGNRSTIGGGYYNIASGTYSTISGGVNNTAFGCYSAIVGGRNNATCSFTCVVIAGSYITADRNCATFVNNLSIKNIPTASAGLPSGSVWSSAGTLCIVP
jgi:hypothetical protein